jgi:hypothetical protein
MRGLMSPNLTHTIKRRFEMTEISADVHCAQIIIKGLENRIFALERTVKNYQILENTLRETNRALQLALGDAKFTIGLRDTEIGNLKGRLERTEKRLKTALIGNINVPTEYARS